MPVRLSAVSLTVPAVFADRSAGAGSDSLTAAVEDEIRAVCRELLANPECPGVVYQRLTTILVCILYSVTA